MINETGNTENSRSPFRPEEFRELGKKGLEPLVGVLTRHKGDLSPYIEAIRKALHSGAQTLADDEGSEAESYIGGYFRDGAEMIGRWEEKLASTTPEEFLRFLQEEGKKHPIVLFGASYFAGLVLGRFGRHLGKTMTASAENIH